ncbi:tumor necrosis factor receptor superfamily member 16-like [Ambystoma mexicanum]|uniref:tumor necrosis factor receptor superfamily member 16-like n=1 Tax=Ambystoma mexicanum TaxID=8296 RepID=UPI0037E97260
MEPRRAILLPIWALILFKVSAVDPCASGRTSQGECCSLCPPGTGVSEPCGSSNTKCESCKRNLTFSSNSSATERCSPCSRCPANMEVLIHCSGFEDTICRCAQGYYLEVVEERRLCLPCRTECSMDEVEISPCTDMSNRICVDKELARSGTAPGCVHCSMCPDHMEVAKPCTCTEDTLCQCPNGTYLHVEDGHSQCMPCQVCPRGHGARTACSQDRDTQCEACPAGFFSEERSSQSPCLPCRSECEEGKVVLRGCTTESDLLCMGKLRVLTEAEKDSKRASDAGSSASPSSPEFIPREDNSKNIIPVYCSILGAVVVGLIAYVAFKCWSTCKQKKQLAKARAGELGSSPETEKLHSDSGVFLDTHSLQEPHQLNKGQKTEPKLYINLPPHKQEEVERLLGDLSHGKDWQRLAILLGFEEDSIDAIGRGEHPVHTLLSSWSTKEGATLEVLCAALVNMQRSDVVESLNSKAEASSVV